MSASTTDTELPAFRYLTAYHIYLALISLIGLLLLLWGIGNIVRDGLTLNLLLLLLLVIFSAVTTTSVAVQNSGITYSIGPVLCMAAVPTLGVSSAVVVAATMNASLWFIKPTQQTWKKSWVQLAFNGGMHATAIAISGSIFLFLQRWLGIESWLGQLLPWLIGGYIYEEINFWLLAFVLRLQHGAQVKPFEMWKEDFWATQIGTLVTAVGGGVLAFAIASYDWIGILIFFLPIALSAYAFRLYVRQMQAHLDNLENIVSERTSQLAERTTELAAINEQKDAFLSVLTHDMMTPLANIQLCAEVIREDGQLSDDSRHLAQLMLHSQKTLHTLVRNILDLAKLQAIGTLPMYKSVVDVGQLLLRTVRVMEMEAREKNIALTCNAPAGPLDTTADAQQLERVFLNLVSNAIKYTPVDGTVSVQAHLQQPYIVIEVQDNGYGIPAEELPYLFERFRRIKQLEDKASGTGLGLAITKALIEQHGGEITVNSVEKQGSTFTVKLPFTG